MSFNEQHFFIVNFGFRDEDGYEITEERQAQTYLTKEECQKFVIEEICKKIECNINTTHEIHTTHSSYFKEECCTCCSHTKMVFDSLPRTIREAKLLSMSYLENYSGDKSRFVFSIHEHKAL
jgi:hypothetical protein